MAFILGAIGVMLGAFAAHGLKHSLTADLISTWKTAVFYQFIHVFLLLYLTMLKPSKMRFYASVLTLAGIVLFCGSLYFICLTQIKSIGMLTPFGGLCFIAAWCFSAVSAYKATSN